MEDALTQIRAAVASWTHNRKLYPGWLIAPRGARDTLWFHSMRWVEVLVRHLGDVPLEERFRWCDELNWRLETAQTPLLEPLVSTFEALIAHDPFLPDAASKTDTQQSRPADPVLREQWLSLAFAVLRAFREAAHTEKFDGLAHRLEAVALDPDAVCRLAYERCLLVLGRLDHKTARHIADNIEIGTADPFWLTRFAAVLCEVGELEMAEKKADEALRSIRSRIGPSGGDLAMLSREGWAMLLARGLRDAGMLTPGNHDRRANEIGLFEGRWKQLELVKCNPRAELENLELRLQRPSPVRPEKEISVGFDQRPRLTVRFAGGGISESLLDALQANRLIEEIGYPPSCGHMNMSRELLRSIARGLKGQSLPMVLPLMLRSEETEDIGRFSRHEVAALSQELVQRLFALLFTAVLNLLPSAVAPRTLTTVAQSNYTRFGAAADLLSRLMVRASVEDMEKVLELALSLLRTAPARLDINVESAGAQLFSRVLEAAPSDLLERKIIELMSVALWPALGDPVHYSNTPSPGQLLINRDFSLSAYLENEQWLALIASLLGTAERGQGLDRSDALWRLLACDGKGGLSADQRRAFGRAFWREDAPGQWRLPQYLSPITMLTVPEAEDGFGARMFRLWCRTQALTPFRQAMPNLPTAEKNPIVYNSDRDQLLDSLVDVSGDPDGIFLRDRVRWDTADAIAIFTNICAWWDTEAEDVSSLLENPHVGHDVHRRFYQILRVFGHILEPWVKEIPDFKVRLLSIIQMLDRLNFPIVFILPLLRQVLDFEEWDIESRFRQALVSTNDRFVNAALDGIFEWVKWEKARQLPEIPTDLLGEVGGIVASRRQPGLLTALRILPSIARRRPDLIQGRIASSVRTGLEYLLHETRYEVEPDTGPSGAIPYAEVPRYRQAAAALAVALRRVEAFRDDAIVSRWLAEAADDPLPEIRRVLDDRLAAS